MTAHNVVRPPHFTYTVPLPVGGNPYHPWRGGTWHDYGLNPTTFPAYGLRMLALVGLLVGALLLALPYMPVAHPAPGAPGVFALGSAPSLILTRPVDRPATVLTRRVFPPHDSFAWEDNLDDDIDDPTALVVLTAGICGHLLALARQGIADVTSVHLWPSHFLLRPQLLTRL